MDARQRNSTVRFTEGNITNEKTSPKYVSTNKRNSISFEPRQSERIMYNQIREFERNIDEYCKNILLNLLKIDEEKNISLRFLRNLIALYSKETKMNESVKRIISTYHIAESIKNDKFKIDYDEVLNTDEFCNLISGKNIKNLLFNNIHIDNKRFYTEDYYKVINILIKKVIWSYGWN